MNAWLRVAAVCAAVFAVTVLSSSAAWRQDASFGQVYVESLVDNKGASSNNNVVVTGSLVAASATLSGSLTLTGGASVDGGYFAASARIATNPVVTLFTPTRVGQLLIDVGTTTRVFIATTTTTNGWSTIFP
jgi:hypothetical protein